MKVTFLDNYHRRGNKVWLKMRFDDIGKRKTKDGLEEYDHSYGWIYGEWDGTRFRLDISSFRIHDTYEFDTSGIDFNELEEILNHSDVAKKIKKRLGVK